MKRLIFFAIIGFLVSERTSLANTTNTYHFEKGAATVTATVTPTWLRQHLYDRKLVVLEVYDHDRQIFNFDKKHIPASEFTAFMDDGWLTLNTGYPYMLPPISQLKALIGHYGISNQTRVILVPGGAKHGDFMATARIYWTFRYLGDRNVSILNGGDIAWNSDRRDPTTNKVSAKTITKFIPHVIPAYLARTATVQSAINNHSIELIDARPEAQFEGIKKAPVDSKAGTLAGAVNLPYSIFLTPDGEGIIGKSAVSTAIQHSGVILHSPAIVFCNTGHLASSDWFVLHEVMHLKDLRLYTGSMSTWTRDNLPVVAGVLKHSHS